MMDSSGKAKGEQVLETESKTQGTTILDISQDGIKMQINSAGESKGKYHSNDLGTTTIWMKTDGTSEWESKAIQMTHDGEMVASWGKGSAKTLSPTKQAWTGEMHYMTQSPKLAWMNTATFWVEGVADNSKGGASAKVYQTK
jgi:hypothetical protein